MRRGFVGRGDELRALQATLDQARTRPAVLIVDGEAGIGKTTLCRAAAKAAGVAGFCVLRTAGAAAEVTLAWAGLADLLAGINETVLTDLSPLHQQALHAVSSGVDAPAGDERLVAAAFRTALEEQGRRRPVAIVVDDAQWLDEPSRLVLGFAVRRLAGRIAVIAAFRSGESGGENRSWLQPPDPQSLTRLTVGPMKRSDFHDLIVARLETAPPARAMSRIYTQSGGNPFYGLELARAADETDDENRTLPATLAGLVRDRIGILDADTTEVMVTAAAAFEPTVEIIAAATGRSAAGVVDILQPLESRGVLRFDGPRIRFTHPLVASAVTGSVDAVLYRRAHRSLADTVDRPEQRARHLALSTPESDPDTLAALDVAADAAAARGAASTAAELASLAIGRGGDTEFRRLRGAELHFRAGALDEAEALLSPVLNELSAGFMRAVGLMLMAAIRGFRDGLASTIGLLQRAVTEAGDDPMLRAQALMLLSTATGIGGDMAGSVELAGRARADTDATGIPDLRSQSLAVWVAANMIHGRGFDAEAMSSALELENPDMSAPIMFRPSSVHAQACAWTGLLDEARTAMSDVLNRCAERGNEIDAVWAAEQLTMVEVGLGRYADAERTATDALQRAQQIGGRLPLISAYTAVASAAAHRGRLEEARVAANFAVEGATAGDLTYVTRAPLMSLAFVQVSAGQYDEALLTLKPLLAIFDPKHDTEIMVGAFLPDAVEALTMLGRADEAEPLAAALETNGAQYDRAWALAVGARCRALVVAAQGDVDAAIDSAEQAMAHHEGLPMPFERARTQLLLGQLQRRRRRTAAARDNLTAAVAVFDEIGSPLWAQRGRLEVERLTSGSTGAMLTDSERQITERAAAGLSNKEIAAALFLSEKTVEMHLSSAYRKLGIRSRTQLLRDRPGDGD